jgi:anhydro-N-acetylmuramic acid kinase
MSGTSIDAVDGALVSFAESGPRGPALQTLAVRSRPMPAALREALQQLQQSGEDELARAAMAGNALSDLYAEVVADLLAAAGCTPAQVAAIGAHGQTVRHRPELGYTIQLLNPARLAERTGIPVVADLRAADVAAGGQGAPLVPAFHAIAFGDARLRRAIANLGGIANVSLLAPLAPDRLQVSGFDTGPANTLLDGWCERHTGRSFDEQGNWAAGGRPIEALLSKMLADPYFSAPPPKSTGRDRFNLDWVAQRLAESGAGHADPQDVQATLAELTAATLASACQRFGAQEVWLCGGGVRNLDLVARVRAKLTDIRVGDTSQLGIDPQAVEAIAFAWLAERRLAGRPANLPAVTGARGGRVLGGLWDARPAP